MSLFRSLGERVRQGLRRTRDLMDEGLGAILSIARPVDEAMLEELEETLIAADLGAAAASAFVKRVRDEVKRGRISSSQDVRGALHRFLTESLAGAAAPLRLDGHPTVILMLGVNGAGKTTSTAKLAASLKADGKHVLMAAADTFRAAAIEQLQEWGRRIDVEVIHQAAGADPAAVVFDAVKAASSRGSDVLLVDTAGRLHTKSNLMDELAKLKRVLGRQLPGAPHESLMVLEAPTGQNGLQQARMFHEAVGLTGLVLTKLDGTAKGGIALRIHQELGVPIKLVGVGEQIEDLQPFEPGTFVDALLGEQGSRRPRRRGRMPPGALRAPANPWTTPGGWPARWLWPHAAVGSRLPIRWSARWWSRTARWSPSASTSGQGGPTRKRPRSRPPGRGRAGPPCTSRSSRATTWAGRRPAWTPSSARACVGWWPPPAIRIRV